MKIAVFCSSRVGNDPVYAECARALGRLMAEKEHTLVYGAEDCGLMKEVSDAMLDADGEVIGYVPESVPFIVEGANPRLSQLVVTPDMGARKQAMMHDADAFIALPGSVGTLDEVTEILSLIKVGEMDKPVAMLNTAGFYEALKTFFEHMAQVGIAGEHDFDRLLITESPAEALAFAVKIREPE